MHVDDIGRQRSLGIDEVTLSFIQTGQLGIAGAVFLLHRSRIFR